MPKESGLGVILLPIENTDKFRMVTAAGNSKNATGEMVKAFLGGSTMTKVNDYYYFQDAETPVLNDFRFYSDSTYLRTQRYNGSTWDDVVVDGGSTTIFHLLEIVKEVTADIAISDGDVVRNLIKSATWSAGVSIGDIDGDSFINTISKIYKVNKIDSLSWKILQSDFSLESTGCCFHVDNTTTNVDGFISEKIKLKGVSLPAGVKLQLKIFKQSDLVNPVWENVTDAELNSNIGADIDIATGEVILKPRFYGIGNTAVRLEVNFSEEVTLRGSTADSTDIYFESYDATIAFSEMTDETNVATHYEATPDRQPFTDAKDTNLSNQSGTNTGDQDLSGLAEKSNVLELDNTTPFTPDADYEPATLLFVENKFDYEEISANTDLDDNKNYIVDTSSNTVTINIPHGVTYPFTIRDGKKKFDSNSCFVTIRDSLNAIVHTAELDKKDKGFIFYNEGGTENDWKYGEIGKGKVEAVASDHIASTDFGDMYTVRKMEIEPTSNIENLDVSSLSPSGILFVNNASNRELRSLAGGIDGDIVNLVHISNADLKIKDPNGYTGQQMMPPGDMDRTMQDYGGCVLVYSATLGQWVVTGLYY